MGRGRLLLLAILGRLTNRCLIADLAKVRKGESMRLDVDAIGCSGGKSYLGFSQGVPPDFEHFLSCGTPAPIAPPKELVVRGLNRYARNSMYIGIIAVLLGETVLTSSLVQFIYTVIVFNIFHLLVVYYEEPNLRRMFGEPYGRYCAAVPRWLPGFRAKDAG